MSVEAVPNLGVGKQDGEVYSVFFCIEINKKIIDLVDHFLRAGIGTVILLMTKIGW